jgi:hypothetical protein
MIEEGVVKDCTECAGECGLVCECADCSCVDSEPKQKIENVPLDKDTAAMVAEFQMREKGVL